MVPRRLLLFARHWFAVRCIELDRGTSAAVRGIRIITASNDVRQTLNPFICERSCIFQVTMLYLEGNNIQLTDESLEGLNLTHKL